MEVIIKGAMTKVEALLDSMKNEGVKATRPNSTQTIYCYAKVGNTDKAEELLRQLFNLPARDEKETRMIAECTLNILLAYRRIAEDEKVLFAVKDRAVQNAEALFKKMSKRTEFTDENKSKFVCLFIFN
jgi:acyl-ACP thioesterase